MTAPGLAGGLESVVLELATGLRRAGHRVTLAAVIDPGAGPHPVTRRAAELGVEVREVRVPPRAYLQEYRQLRRIIARLCPDVIHSHGYRSDLIGGLAARRAGVPWVSTVHGFAGGDLKNRFYEWLQIRAHRAATAVVAVSGPLRVRLIEEGVSPDRIHLLPNSRVLKPCFPRDEARRRLGIHATESVIGWVGRFSREKGADVFVEALALLPDRQWRASLLGAGRERQALEAQARMLGIADRIRWHGLVPDAAQLYPAFDLWVLSSRAEGTPIALLEAMASRVPVVATAVGGVPDVVSPSQAVLVPPESPGALAEAIDVVRSDPASGRSRAEAAYQRLLDQFAPELWLDAHVALYRTLVPTNCPRA